MIAFVQTKYFVLLLISSLAQLAGARLLPIDSVYGGLLARRALYLVDTPAVILDYHNGPVVTGVDGSIPILLIWYGNFNETDKSAVAAFLGSFQGVDGTPTDVTRWWNVTGKYRDGSGASVAGSVHLAGELNDEGYSRGKALSKADIEALVLSSLPTFPANSESMYFVLTAADVDVEDFCMNACASHSATTPSAATGGLQLPYAWVGNPKDQCAGMCGWPFALPPYMPATTNLPLPPNGDVGTDAMIIQMSYMLVGIATNPFDNAFFQGDASAPLEAGTACFGFGVGAYSGYPGDLEKDVITGAVFNAEGVNDRKFLLPSLWDPSTRTCRPLTSFP